jgi:large subunit ribosomal protein L10
MNRQEKQSIIDAVKDDFQQSQAAFIVGTHGMDVDSIQKLRMSLYTKQGKMKVVKNTLLVRATEDLAGIAELKPFFKKQIAVVFVQNEAPAIAKMLFDATKDGQKLILVGGTLDAKLISPLQIEHLANLPSKEVLLAQLCGTMNAPIASYVRVLNELAARFVRVLKQIENTKH